MPRIIPVEDLPGPKGKPFIGNLMDLDMSDPPQSLIEMQREYGPIFTITVAGSTRMFLCEPGPGRRDLRRRRGAQGDRHRHQASERVADRGLFISANDDPCGS